MKAQFHSVLTWTRNRYSSFFFKANAFSLVLCLTATSQPAAKPLSQWANMQWCKEKSLPNTSTLSFWQTFSAKMKFVWLIKVWASIKKYIKPWVFKCAAQSRKHTSWLLKYAACWVNLIKDNFGDQAMFEN